MTTIIFIFLLSALVALIATPYVGKLGRWMGALDYPDDRKVHDQVIPRCGGLAIYLGLFLPFLSFFLLETRISELLQWNRLTLGFLVGGSLILLVGLWDDIRGLNALTKFILQVTVAGLAWWSGFRIDVIGLPYLGTIQLSLGSMPLTVIWFVAIINAINLIDGLDGLATGTALFASIILAIVSLLRNNYLGALMFASFSGALLGFLRYNFNPASIFLGDSGSYFIGFLLAALGVGTSQKSSMAIAILIPIVALGLPLMDTVLAALRRFIYGSKIFEPDKEHIHHRLLKLGYTPKRAALILFGITVLLGLTALLMENLRDDRIGLVLGALALMSILGIRKLGYLDYFTGEKILGWFADVTDETGISKDRRTFLSNQVAIHGSDNIYQLWCRTVYAAEKIKLSAVSLELSTECFIDCTPNTFKWNNGDGGDNLENGPNRLLKIQLPLVSNGKCLGMFYIEKILHSGNDDRLALRRIEHLRRTIISALKRLLEKSLECPEVLNDRRNSCHLPRNDLHDHSQNELATSGLEDDTKYTGPRDRRRFWKKEADNPDFEKDQAEDHE